MSLSSSLAWKGYKLPLHCCMGGKHDWAAGHHFDAAWSGCFGWCGGWTSMRSLGPRGQFRTKFDLARKTLWRRCTP